MNDNIVKFRDWLCVVTYAQYGNGRTAIQLKDKEDGSPIATASLNIPGTRLAKDEIIIKDYSENHGMAQALADAGIVSDPIRYTKSGYVEKIPICKILDDERFNRE